MYTNTGFTSKLPVSSARRPTNNRDGSTSFVGQSLHSNIPVTVRKANLFTPKTQRPFMTGTSTAGKSYMSAMTSEKKKYARPLKPAPDRDLQIKMFDNLVDFFKNNAPHLPSPEAKKFFSSVSTTESTRIFDLLISKIDPEIKITKLEVDVPEALAALDYPYIRSVTKSALVSVTTRQAAVGLLVIFDWLIRCIKVMEPISDERNVCDESIDEKKQKFAVIYAHPPERVQEVCSDLYSRLKPLPDILDIVNSLEEATNEKMALEESLAESSELEQEIATLLEDIIKSESYSKQMEDYVKGLEEKCYSIEQQSNDYSSQNEGRKESERQIRAKVELGISKEDVERDLEEYEKLKREADILERQESLATLKKDQVKEKNQLLVAKFDRAKIEILNQMNKTISRYQSHCYSSKLWTERRLEMENWVSRFNQAPIDDFEQWSRLMHEKKLLLEWMYATDELLESEIRDGMTDRQLELEKLEASNKKAEETLRRLDGDIDRVSREIDNVARRGDEELSRLQTRCKEIDRNTQTLMEKRQAQEDAYTRELNVQQKWLLKDKEDSEETIKLSKKTLELVKERTHSQAVALVKRAQSEAIQFQEARKIMEENYEISKKINKLFKGRLNTQ